MMNDIHDLELLVKAHTPIVVIESWDEPRVLELLTRLAMRCQQGLQVWSVTEGLHRLGFGHQMDGEQTRQPEQMLRAIKQNQEPGFYVLCDVHPYLKDEPINVRLMKEIAMQHAQQRQTLILLSHQLELPPELKRFSARFALSLPSDEQLEQLIREEAASWTRQHRGRRVRTDNRTLQRILANLRGLALPEARQLVRAAIIDDGALTCEDLPEMNRAKFALMDMESVLSFEYDLANFADLGGLSNLKAWLRLRQQAFDEGGADQPKGVLLLGVQGGGKSLAAKAVAGLWGLPLLRLDFGTLYNKFFGETERNLREALQMAELMSPCVLWLDEIEKGIATGDYDSGTSRRLLGTLLTWMAERRKPVFMVATANDISQLPPELMRKGRMDEIFFVDLPEAEARREIFAIHLHKRDLAPETFDLEGLALAAEGFSGAEIEQAVVAACYSARASEEPVTQGHLIRALTSTRPLSVVMAEELGELRRWAAGRTVPA